MANGTYRWYLIAAVAACVIAAPGAALPDTVALGTDYFETQPGTVFNGIPLMGDPFGPGATDTIVQRLSDVTIGSSGSLMLTGLQLESISPATIGAFSGPIFISLDPANLTNDTGTISIGGSTAGGTFTSALNVYFDVCTAPGVNGVGCGAGVSLETGSLPLTNSGANWSPTPAAGTEIVSGLYGDQAANLHTGLPTGEVDFFINPPGFTESGPGAGHAVTDATTPEPGSFVLLGTALLLGLPWLRRPRII